MQILSYPIGLLIGLFPIAVDLGESRAPAHLLLDSRPVCEVTERSPGCQVDLGPDPRVHLLELLRTDGAGRVTERVARWVNRPGIEPEVLVSGSCDEKTSVCEFGVTWAHPEKLDPKKLALQLDGAKRWEEVSHRVAFPIAKGQKPQVVSCDVEFPDGTRATYSRTLYAFNPEEAQASLASVPVLAESGAGATETIAARVKEAGLPVRTVEEAEPEVTFVMDPRALDLMVEMGVTTSGERIRRWPAFGSTAFEKVRVVFPTESLPADTVKLDRLGAIFPSATRSSRFSRYADAVAAAGYGLGASPRRRAVVLVLPGFSRPNASSFTAAQARAYLEEVMVPLVVWRVGNVAAPEWPAGPILESRRDVLKALEDLRKQIDRQRILWLEGFHDTRFLGRWLVPGVALAGRDAPSPSDADLATTPGQAPVPSLGPDGGPVHALGASADGASVYAGTHGGVFRSRDRGVRWESASAGLPLSPVRCVEVDTSSDVVFAGTDEGLFKSTDAGTHWRRSSGEPGAVPIVSLALDSAGRVLYVGTAGHGVLRSDDGGETLLSTALGRGDARALAVDAKDRALLAATESGVFRSVDRGWTWVESGRLPARTLGLGFDAKGILFAATAGQGLWSSADSGATWRKTGLVGSFLTSVAFGPAASRLVFAGSPDGVFVSQNAGAAWKLAHVGPVEALVAGTGAPLAGSARGALRRLDSGGWKDSSAGLTASIAYAVAPDTGGGLYAATSSGLVHCVGPSACAGVPGVPEGVVADAVVPFPRGDDLYIGTTGSIARSEDSGATWSFAPTHAAFHLALDPSKPDVILAAAREGVLKSEDGGKHWYLAVSGMEKTFALQLGHDPAEPDTYYAATAGGGVFRTVDAGRSWKAGGSALTRRIVRSVAADPADRQVVWAGTDSGVFRSADRGEDWLPASEGLPRAPVYALAPDPEIPGALYAGTAEGLFRSADGGEHWEAFPKEGLRAAVLSLSLDRAAGSLMVGSLGAGVFCVPLADENPPR